MADTVATLTYNAFPNGKDLTIDHFHGYGTVSLSPGTYPSSGIGIPLNWASALNTSVGNPFYAEFLTMGSPPGVYEYVYDLQSNTLRILEQNASASTGTAPFSEFPEGAPLPAPILNDLIAFHAIFNRA